jgi:hypothetical protein
MPDHPGTDLFIKAMRQGGHIVLEPDQELFELPDGTFIIIDMSQMDIPMTITLDISDK